MNFRQLTIVDAHMYLSRVLDVVGQRNSQRNKWIHCFEDVSAVIFMADLSAYDQAWSGNDSANRLTETIALFEHILNLRFDNRQIISVRLVIFILRRVFHSSD